MLRNDLGLVGSRFGCGSGQCGACFVLVDGEADGLVRHPLWSSPDKQVTTVEGLEGGELQPVQKALIAEQAAQCGYCMSGIAVAAAAFSAAENEPSEEANPRALDETSAAAARTTAWCEP